MHETANPIRREGSKNIYCPHYEKCLDYAAARIWQFWDCRECPHRDARQPIVELRYTVDDAFVIFELPIGVSAALS